MTADQLNHLFDTIRKADEEGRIVELKVENTDKSISFEDNPSHRRQALMKINISIRQPIAEIQPIYPSPPEYVELLRKALNNQKQLL